ncbi:MAG: hypothetical protein ABUT20_28130 [Bacteroidota bacterium]
MMLFDNYTLKARFYPVVLVFFPLVIVGIFYSFQFQSVIHLLTSIGLVGALTYMFSQVGRDSGKLKEPSLWKSWGGMPTVQILRLADDTLDPHTKNRYHQKLFGECPVPVLPTIAMETNNAAEADEIYKAWTRYLITKTRDAEKFPLLLKDNTSYGFRRNLWGLKAFAISFIVLLLSGNYLFWVYHLRNWNPLIFPETFEFASAVLLINLLVWLFIIRRDWVKIPAFSYAGRLCEGVEEI